MSQIFIHRDGEDQGPYTLEQVQACLIVGTLTPTDFAWYDGLPDWISLSAAIVQIEQQGQSASDGWRRKVATADQKAELRCLGLKAKRDLTQGGYQDLIDEACGDAANKSKLEVFRLKRTKEKEFLAFLQKNAFRLRIMAPTMAQLRETIDFLHDSIPNWAIETSPEEFAKLVLIRYPDIKGTWESSIDDVDDPTDWGDAPATERQLDYLRNLGGHFSPDINKADASELIDRLKNQASDAQKRRLTFYGLDFDPLLTKEQASTLIDCYRERHPESEDAYQEWKIKNHITSPPNQAMERTATPRVFIGDDGNDIADYRRRLDQLIPPVRELLPAWTPERLEDADSYMCYVATVEEALEHAKFADLESLQSDLFYDGVTDVGYYLEFTRDPTPSELLAFQAGLFQGYLLAESEKFDHLAILKRTLPMINASVG